MIFVVVLVIIAALVVAVIVGVAKDPGPSPVEVALGFEHAWDLHDYDVLYRMSGPELHEGLKKADWVAAKRAQRGGSASADHVVDVAADAEQHEGEAAVVTTRLTMTDGSVRHNEVRMLRRSRAWEVVARAPLPSSAG